MRARQSLKVICVAVLAASVCGVFPSAAQDDPYRDIHSIGIISAFGDQIRLQNWGVTRFTNDSTNVNAGWKLDEEVLALVSNAARDKFAIKEVQTDAAAMRDIMVKPLF
ncbi:MAG TPA: hypothetical protein VGG66_02095, partial [Rhizomicrobium sp.]